MRPSRVLQATATVNFFSTPPGLPFDRCDAQRRSEDWVREQQRHATAKAILVSSNGKFVRAPSSSPGLKATTPDGSQSPPLRLWHEQPAIATADPDRTFFLGLYEQHVPLFAQLVDEKKPTTPPLELEDARKALMFSSIASDPVDASLACFAYSLAMWHASASFCGFCGSPTRSAGGGKNRKCGSEACAKETYPRVNPVAIMAVISPDGNKMLLGQTKVRHKANMYSTLAGFVDQGESLEDAVRREVMEEAGVLVGDVAYHSSQPWPFPGNLMLGCVCRAESESIRVDPHEMGDVRWFSREEVQTAVNAWPDGEIVTPPSYAIAHHLIQFWLDGGSVAPLAAATAAAAPSNASRL